MEEQKESVKKGNSDEEVIQIPIGAEENFKVVVDLIKMKAILWHDETMGAEYDVEDIPADLADEAAEWRDKLL